MPKQNIQALPPHRQPPAVKPRKKAKPANLDKAALAAIKEQLQADVLEYQQQLKDLDTESFTSNQTDVSGERAGMGEDFADAGTATFDRERDLSIRNNVLDLMDQVTRALARIEEGTYGTCESCGTPIDGDRIKAFPRSLMCIDCKRREERIR
jgi:DnaK suppressor protein